MVTFEKDQDGRIGRSKTL